MAIARVGTSAVEAASITLPGTFQNGDLAFILAFRTGSVTAPSLPAGWTQSATGSVGTASYMCGYRQLISGADTSGTWTNATALCCGIYRNIATNKSLTTMVNNSGRVSASSSANITYGTSAILLEPANSWLLGLAATTSTTSNIATAPASMTNQTNLVGASGQYVVHDTNGVATSGGTYSSTVAAGAAITSITFTFEILAEQLGNFENYKFVKAPDGISVGGDKIR